MPIRLSKAYRESGHGGVALWSHVRIRRCDFDFENEQITIVLSYYDDASKRWQDRHLQGTLTLRDVEELIDPQTGRVMREAVTDYSDFVSSNRALFSSLKSVLYGKAISANGYAGNIE